ncbi:transcriptional regulator with XRE-family HTH domain [Lipingzhangella halophila]|uniref:Transcriptional regulator with XRE-family HTH domain n=1 Tax=Lipingzhangella halophila TaxID=1783352 RepID=A0A7W7RI44_9ACTN|nr:helix-turn-helix transcriptional regulator [Lipingzhangella halophila]MBB4931871.1 transcriptional regulator with XRE-family HTH domain [Lipingzhangella halophila]
MPEDTPTHDTSVDTSVADRVREIRKRRGLNQEELAEAAGVSVTVVRKIEQGGTARMETYNALGRVLKVRTVWFMTAESPAPVLTDDGRDSVLADIRSAVNPPASLAGRMFGAVDGDPDLTMLGRAVKSVADAYQDDRYDDVARFAPALVRSAHMHVAALDGDERASAQRMRGDALQLTGRYLVQIREHDLALIALRDALADAVEVGDQCLAAAAIGQQGWALLRQARFDEVEALCVNSADEIEPRMSKATPDQLSAWGYLLMRASAAAARNNNVTQARDLQSVAESAAVRIQDEHEAAGHMRFGPVTAAMNGMQNELIGGHPDRALERADSLPGQTSGATQNTQQRFALDRANALVQVGDTDQATEVMMRLRRQAPEWLRYQRTARNIAEDIVESRPRMPSEDQRQIADFLGVPV